MEDSYPKWLYRRTVDTEWESRIVHTPQEHERFGYLDGWYESPADLSPAEAPARPELTVNPMPEGLDKAIKAARRRKTTVTSAGDSN